jgi:glycosyltransferase involved in cell wall biosynthesis
MPRNTVVTPNYSHARDLPRRLDSIVAQTYQDFALIILDEASTDNSREVIESHAKDPGEGDLQCREQRRHLQTVDFAVYDSSGHYGRASMEAPA